MCPDASAHTELQLGPGLCVGIEAKITLRERIVTWPFNPEVQSGSYRDGAHGDKVTVEAREQLAQCMLPAGEQRMHVPALWNARTFFRVLWQRVTLQHHHVLEVVRQRACCR
jgi:hypothetical protein